MQNTMTKLVIACSLLIFLSSCGVPHFDNEIALAKNKVKVMIERSYRFENKKRILVLENFSYLKTNGKMDSIITKMHFGNNVGESRKYFHYNFAGVLDSIQIISYQDTSLFINTEVHNHGLFGTVYSISFYTTFNHKRNLDAKKTVSYKKNGLQKTETYLVFPNKEIQKKDVISLDGDGKIIYAKSFIKGFKNPEFESYDFQYADDGKIVSSKKKNDGVLHSIHNYEYLENDLRKSRTIIQSDGDSLYLHLYSYEFGK